MNQEIANNIEAILDELGIDYTERNGQYRLPCPVHGGKGKNCSIYVTDKFEPNWRCWSYNCHSENSSLMNFIMLTLNKNFKETKEWLKKFGVNGNYKKIDKTFTKTINIILQQRKKSQFKIPIQEVKKYKDSVDFYINRGFNKKTLKKFGVKYCQERKNFLNGYIIVPVLNDDGKSIAGFIGRSPNPKCLICEKYHKPNDPCSKNGAKWKNTYGFNNNSFLYNLWNAKKFIEKTNEVILVEGSSDVWRFYEAGIYNVLGMFGTSLSVDQKIILESLPLIKIKLFLDPDKAGVQATKILEKSLSRFYTVEVINYKKQPSECSAQELRGICGN